MGLDTAACTDLNRLLQLEWLETNGLGDYASSTVSGINTRRQHGLLIAGPPGTTNCRLLCAKLDESVFINGQRHELAANEYRGAFHPQGYRFLVGFEPWPWPTWTYEVEGVRIEKQVLMLYEQRITLVGYRLMDPDGLVGLELRPLLAGRDCQSLMIENWNFRRQASSHDRRLTLTPYDERSRIWIGHPNGQFGGDGFWFYNFIYRADEGPDAGLTEDLFSPGAIASTLRPNATVWTILAAQDPVDLDPREAVSLERARRGAVDPGPDAPPLKRRLVIAADAFRIRHRGAPSVVSGYPWCGVRQRDTLIALPGLTLAAGLPEVAREMLACASAELRDLKHPAAAELYGIDGPLWFGLAARRYLDATSDVLCGQETVRTALVAWLGRLQAGPLPGVWIEPDGLLAQSLPDRALTWMNGASDGGPATPRRGKAVELNALWHTVLRLAEDLGEVVEPTSADVAAAFLERFWDAERGYLLDVADGPDGDDASCRPNQLLALSCDPGLVPDEIAAQVLDVVAARLLTPCGLRTLAPDSWGYCGRLEGTVGAEHQGAVWPWLLGAYADALRRVAPDPEARLAELLAPLEALLDQRGVGQISERFDGDSPHTPRGCLASALSVAELLRIC